MTRALHSDEFRGAYTAAIPMKRHGTPVETAAVVPFPASDRAACLTGVAIRVGGDFMAAGAL